MTRILVECDGQACSVRLVLFAQDICAVEKDRKHLRGAGWPLGVVGPEYPEFLMHGPKDYCPTCAGARVVPQQDEGGDE